MLVIDNTTMNIPTEERMIYFLFFKLVTPIDNSFNLCKTNTYPLKML